MAFRETDPNTTPTAKAAQVSCLRGSAVCEGLFQHNPLMPLYSSSLPCHPTDASNGYIQALVEAAGDSVSGAAAAVGDWVVSVFGSPPPPSYEERAEAEGLAVDPDPLMGPAYRKALALPVADAPQLGAREVASPPLDCPGPWGPRPF